MRQAAPGPHASGDDDGTLDDFRRAADGPRPRCRRRDARADGGRDCGGDVLVDDAHALIVPVFYLGLERTRGSSPAGGGPAEPLAASSRSDPAMGSDAKLSVFVATRFLEEVESAFSQAFEATFHDRGGRSPRRAPGGSRGRARFDVVLFSLNVQMGAAEIASLPEGARALATYSVGTDHIDFEAAAARALAVFNIARRARGLGRRGCDLPDARGGPSRDGEHRPDS